MTIVATFLLILYSILFFYVLDAVLRGKFEYVLLFSVIFFPIYALFLTFNYDAFELPILVNLIQYSKEIVIFGALGVWISGQRNMLNRKWEISFLDGLFLSFLVLSFIFFVLGVGEATFTNRAVYLKNILLIGIFYFFGRQIKIDFKYWDRVFNVIFIMTVLACGLIILERVFSTHFHTLVGYAKYNLHLKDFEPVGTYGLNWTFEAEGGRPRYGSFFANPLELSSSMLISVALSTIYLLSVPYKTNKSKYFVILACSFICVLLAYSRASFVAFFLMLIFIAFLMRYYKILKAAIAVAVCIVLYISFFAADEVRYFVIDTLTFQNSSSLTHIVDWLKAVESMLSNPMGIGLAMSGNAGGVEESLIVGGENQYLIYGVQLGFLGALIYIGMLFFGIRDSWRAFRLSRSRQEAVIPFVAASVKFGLLLPLFTANAEAYIYVSLISWWFIGYAETIYQRNKKYQVLS
ncbi:O-antigen ligase family protein [Roseivirga sp.]|uniref:O-antigen ligase family protein n=1 Tax=Roseivirga sp. TaxID=1964215 RepID=UPI002B267828|nr:O-antigen ligase family protein [Roseivirga sp.]